MLHELVVLGGALAAGLLAVASPCALPSAEPVPEGTACGLVPASRSARELAQGSLRRPAVVEVTSHHCPACRKMEPVVAEAERGCNARVVRAFIEERDGAALLVRHGIEGVPTFLVLDASGKEVDRLVGAQSVESLRHALRRVSSGPC
jgi:cytochrome c-type biogenesis protein